MKKLLRRFLPVIAIIACPSLLSGQALSDTLPLGSGVLEGRLPNGLRYVVRQNPFPAGKIEFRVVMNVGSILENDAQKGMTHFLEHMIFNGSRDFPGDSVIRVLKTMGIKYGYDLNAFTDYDKTIYILPVPTDEPEYTDIALRIMHGWVNELNLYPADIEKEKKIVVQEIRDAVPHDIFHDTKLAGSRYPDRFVLGTEQSVTAIDSAALRAYYDNWYRPDLITIIAVGDLDPAEMKGRIASTFGGMKPRSENPPVREIYSLPLRGGIGWQQEPDTLARKNALDIIFPVADIRSVTYADQRELLKESLFRNLLDARLSDEPKIGARYSRDWYLSDVAHKVFEVGAGSDDEMNAALTALGRKLAQVRRYGFRSDEVEAAKKALLARQSAKDYDRNSQSICDDFIDLAVTGDRHLPNSELYRFRAKAIETITPQELAELAEVFFDKGQRMILCYRYNPATSSVKDEKGFLKAFRKGLKSKTEPYVYVPKAEKAEEEDAQTAKFSVGHIPDAGIASERYYPVSGVTELTLSNGLRVALKPTPMAESNELMVSLLGTGGFSALPEGEAPYYQGTPAYLDMGGIEGMSNDEMNAVAYANEVAVSINIDNYFQELYGVAFEGDVDQLMKYIYLRITASEKNQEAFDEDIESSVEGLGEQGSWLLKQLQNDPFRVLQNRVAHISGAIAKDTRELDTADELRKQNLDAMYRFYEMLFGNPASLVAVITGNFDMDEVRDAAVKYLGALPVRNGAPSVRFMGQEFPEGVYRDTITSPEMTRSYVSVLLHGHYEQSLRNTIMFKMMRDILQTRIIGSLREGEGLVYSPYVNVTYRACPDPAYYFDVNYFCDPQNEAQLETLLFREIDKLRQGTIPEDELRGIKQSFRIAKREQLDDSNAAGWRNKLKEMYLEDGAIDDFDRYDAILKNITTEDIRDAFKQFVSPERYSVITIEDEK